MIRQNLRTCRLHNSACSARETRRQSQDWHRCQASQKHYKLHGHSGNDQRPAGFDCFQRVAHYLLDRNDKEFRTYVGLCSRAPGNLLEFGYDGAGTNSANAYARAAKLGSKRL